jgi:hypothetical protein
MYKKSWSVVVLVVAGAVALSITAARGNRDATSPSAAPLVHVVIFELKKDAPADAAAGLITDAHGMLAKIASVREVSAGKPAPKTGRARSDYAVGLLVRFENVEGLKAYEKDPLHTAYVSKHLKNMANVTVYDFVDQRN